MFRKLNKSKKISLTCPLCGHVQGEPSLVISSFCRACGEHFRVIKRRAIPNPGLRVSGLAEVREPVKEKEPPFVWDGPEEDAGASEDSWIISADDKELKARPLPEPVEEDEDEDENDGISAGAFFGLAVPEKCGPPEKAGGSTSLGGRAQSRNSLAEGSMAALIQSQGPVLDDDDGKMPPNYQPPDKRRRVSGAASEFEVRCFRCYHIQHVSRFAKSTQCERCSVYITLANYVIKTVKSHTLRTRGDITIGRRGGLKKCEIACHHLTVNGVIDAFVDCSGDAVFRHSGTVRGNLYCRKLLIEKNCVVEFPDGVKAERAEIQGQLIGDLTCSGTVRLSRTGSISGNVQAVEIDMKDEAVISGATSLDPDTSTELPVKMGFNPSVIG